MQMLKEYKEIESLGGRNIMNSKWHLYISLVKSAIRIVGCIFGLKGSLKGISLMFLMAEGLGVLEEVGDKR